VQHARTPDDHRGQAHAMLTAAGEDTGDTDIFIMPWAAWNESA
jgi:uncharacterized damage-inducible protein DinB